MNQRNRGAAASKKALAAHDTDPGAADVMEELRKRYQRMTRSQKRITEFVVENAEVVAFSTVEQMAAKLEVNPSTIVRFAYRLGLNGFPDLQERMRQIVRNQISRANEPAGEIRTSKQLEGTTYGASLTHDAKNLHRTIAGLNKADLDRSVALLKRARTIYVSAGRGPYPAAHFFSLILHRLRPNVVLLGNENALSSSYLTELSGSDCLVAFTFPRYSASTYRNVQLANEAKASVIAVTDSPISAVGRSADVVLLAATAGTGLHTSLVAPMAIANALLNGMVVAIGDTALERYARYDQLMTRSGSFLLKDDESD